MPDEKKTIDVIEIRKAGNGYVICAWTSENDFRSEHCLRGYETHVVEGDDPGGVTRAVGGILKKYAFSNQVPVRPARRLP